MNKFLLSLAAAAILAWATVPDASARNYYVKAEVGQVMDAEAGGFALGDDPTVGGYVGTAVGPLRVEGGVSRLSADTDFGIEFQADALYYNATAYLDLPSGFFVGAGVGYMDAEAEFGPVSFEDDGYAYHVAGGYAARLNDRMVGEVQVRYIDADLDTIGDVNAVTATVGLRVRL